MAFKILLDDNLETIYQPFEGILVKLAQKHDLNLIEKIIHYVASYFDVYNQRFEILKTTYGYKPEAFKDVDVKTSYWPLTSILVKKAKNQELNFFEKIIDYIAVFFNFYNEQNILQFEPSQELPNTKQELPIEFNRPVLIAQKHIKYQNSMNVAFKAKDIIAKRYADKFSDGELNTLLLDIVNPTEKISQALQKFIDLEWSRCTNNNTPIKPVEVWQGLKWLDENFAVRDINSERWGKVNFVFSNEYIENDQTKLRETEKEYPSYILQVLKRDSEYIKKTLLYENKKTFNFGKQELFEEFINLLCPGFLNQELIDLETLDFKRAHEYFVEASKWSFKPIENSCIERLVSLVSKTATNKMVEDEFQGILEILSSCEGLASHDSFREAAMKSFKMYLKNQKSGKELQSTLRQLRDVVNLRLELPSQTTDEDLQAFFEAEPKLMLLDLSACPKLTNKGLKGIWHLENLKSLIIKDNNNISTELFSSIDVKSKLEFLVIDSCSKVKDNTLLHPEKFNSLNHLELIGLELDSKFAQSLANLDGLEVLNLAGSCTHFKAEDFLSFPNKLINLNVKGSTVLTDVCLEYLAINPLKILNLSGCSSLTLQPDCLNYLKSMKELISLHLPITNHFDQLKFKEEFNEQNNQAIDINFG